MIDLKEIAQSLEEGKLVICREQSGNEVGEDALKAVIAALRATPPEALPTEPTDAMIEAGRKAIMALLEPTPTPRPKVTISELEAMLNSEEPPQINININININPDGSFTEFKPHTTTAKEVAKIAYKAMREACVSPQVIPKP